MMSHFKNIDAKIIYITILPFNLKSVWKPLRFFLLLINFVMYSVQLVRILYNNKIDIIDGRLLAGGIYGLLAKKIMGLPVVVTLYQKSDYSFLGSLCSYLLRSSDVIICDSQMRLDELKEWIGKSKARFLVIPSAIEVKFSDKDELRRMSWYREDKKKIVIGQIASIIPFKGQDLLIDVFGDISALHSMAELWLIGYSRDDIYYDRLQQQACELGIGDKVRFISYPGYIGDVFKMIDIQVHASRFDSLPNSILEGMSLGKALIASSVGGIPEVVDHGLTGLLFEVNDRRALADHLSELIVDEKKRERLGQAARKRFEEGYSPDFLIKQLEDEIADLTTCKR